MTRDAKRSQRIEETRKTADNHRQLWTAQDDQIVLDHGVTWDQSSFEHMDDMHLAVFLGRTVVAVSQRRIVLNKLLEQGMTLEEIHEVERHRRAVKNNRTYTITHNLLQAMCPECFCYPHIPGCSQE